MKQFVTKARTAVALGLPNIGRAVAYRLGVKLGLNPVRRLQAHTPGGPFFSITSLPAMAAPAVRQSTGVALFSYLPLIVSEDAPDWLANPLTRKRLADAGRPWWQIPDFDSQTGDIKLVWELSRMDWVLALAQRARQGDAKALEKLNAWLSDWCNHNPPYRGPNWKCGQEASIRVMHLAMTALILDQAKTPKPGLRDLISTHLERIAPTVQYAMAQDNNHGTSEAAALFIGGSWLALLDVPKGHRWARAGRRLLENRASRLIGEQGSFSQYSLNYHRVMLDTFCMAEVWRQRMGLPAFGALLQQRTKAATEWLRHMIDLGNGDGPNVGANDGARLLQLTDSSYRDHRPTVQLAMALFAQQRAYVAGPWDDNLHWLGVSLPTKLSPAPADYVAKDGGFAMLRRGRCMAMLRYPRFKFRPSQADALHLDVWLGGENVLRDAGTFSYNTEPELMAYFGGTASHNTVQFDSRDQMPRLSRFLWGDWLETNFVEDLTKDAVETRFAAGYKDSQGASHRRHVSLRNDGLLVVDEVTGFSKTAVLRWRLMPGDWRTDATATGLRASSDALRLVLEVKASGPVACAGMVEGWESRHYLEKTPLAVLELEIRQPSTLTTELRWHP